jgi:hypothetical protein
MNDGALMAVKKLYIVIGKVKKDVTFPFLHVRAL